MKRSARIRKTGGRGGDWLTHRLQVRLVHLCPIERSPLRLAGRVVVQAGVDATLAAVDYFGLEAYYLHT